MANEIEKVLKDRKDSSNNFTKKEKEDGKLEKKIQIILLHL